ncbi:hypothetical protein SAMN05216388_10698 [Halorientalis persicus]|uniref:Uncharacterized protein n=1 Tax=Halorientalis persicus TaxID=1367881 RepID=A0A1H8WPT3_9EURY|nr:hypothetical protein SAMN05216388_10698 [Halorientalis persicus]
MALPLYMAAISQQKTGGSGLIFCMSVRRTSDISTFLGFGLLKYVQYTLYYGNKRL